MISEQESHLTAPLPALRTAGLMGMAAGLLLVGEATSFMMSGWSAEAFASPSAAMQVLRNGGGLLRLAALFGFAGLAATILLAGGLSARLRHSSPTLASCVLYFTIVGATGHALVPLSLWTGIPSFLAMSGQPSLISGGWTGFNSILYGAQGVGNLFLGLAMFCAGIALTKERLNRRWAGWTALVAGLLTLFILLAVGTPWMAIAGRLYMPTLIFTILFRFLAGLELFLTAS